MNKLQVYVDQTCATILRDNTATRSLAKRTVFRWWRSDFNFNFFNFNSKFEGRFVNLEIQTYSHCSYNALYIHVIRYCWRTAISPESY